MACGSEEYSCTSTTPQSSDAFSFFNLEAEGATLKRPCSPHMHREHIMRENDEIPQDQRCHTIGWWSLRSWLADFTFRCWTLEIPGAPNSSNLKESSESSKYSYTVPTDYHGSSIHVVCSPERVSDSLQGYLFQSSDKEQTCTLVASFSQ